LQTARIAVAALPALPAALLVACALRLAWHLGGSIAATDWLGYAVMTALLLAALAFAGVVPAPPRSGTVAVTALLALGVWAFASLEWSPLPTLARDEGLLTLWYALVVALALAGARTIEARLGAVAVAALGIAAFAVATAAALRFGAHPLTRYDHGRLAFPISYANAQASLFAIGFWPSVVLAARRTAHPLARGVLVGAAAVCLGGALLPQSKGALLGLAVSTLVVVALSPARLRLLVPAGIAVAGGAAAFRSLTAPFRAYTDTAEVAAIHRAGSALLLLAAGGAIAGLVYALLDRRIEPGAGARRRAGIAALAVAALALLGGLGAAALTVDDPGTFLQRQWTAFTHTPEHERGSTHLLTLGSYRYDYWTVAAHRFTAHPLAGIGARGFGPAYLVHGHSNETPARAHSVAMDALAEQGVVGFALLALALGALVLAAARGARARRAPAVAGLGAGLTWLAQALVDWTWTFPAVTVPALVLLAVAAGADGSRIRPGVARSGGGVAVAAALLLFAPIWVAGRIVNHALETRDGAGLTWAHRLDPVSVQPLLARFQLESASPTGLAALEAAARKEPRSVAVRYTLGIVQQQLGRRDEARATLRAALALKPDDPAILAALRRG
jgi:hypothetical protein